MKLTRAHVGALNKPFTSTVAKMPRDAWQPVRVLASCGSGDGSGEGALWRGAPGARSFFAPHGPAYEIALHTTLAARAGGCGEAEGESLLRSPAYMICRTVGLKGT